MFSHFISLGSEVNLGAIVLLLFSALWLWHAVNSKRRGPIPDDNLKLTNAKGAPPTFPYIIPFVGSLPTAYLLNARAFVLDRKYAHYNQVLVPLPSHHHR